MNLDDGKLLVKAARKIVEDHLNDTTSQNKTLESKFLIKSGVFVTLNNSLGLRGCIGYALPDRSLFLALRDAAIAAATNDPRFPPLKYEELNSIIFEVTVLTPPEKILVEDPVEYLSKIKVGRDGLIITSGQYSGLLLPQVPVEYKWDEEEFLEQVCQKAGLAKDHWKKQDIEIQKFQGIIFKEESPSGNVIQEL